MTFDLTEQEANMVLQALAAQPYSSVYQLIAKLQRQATEQQTPKPEPPQEDE
jgi:hypothetical protein